MRPSREIKSVLCIVRNVLRTTCSLEHNLGGIFFQLFALIHVGTLLNVIRTFGPGYDIKLHPLLVISLDHRLVWGKTVKITF